MNAKKFWFKLTLKFLAISSRLNSFYEDDRYIAIKKCTCW